MCVCGGGGVNCYMWSKKKTYIHVRTAVKAPPVAIETTCPSKCEQSIVTGTHTSKTNIQRK